MINKINNLPKKEFLEVFGNVFENASWIAEKLYTQKLELDTHALQQLLILYMLLFYSILKDIMIYLCQPHGCLLDYYVGEN